MLRPLSPLLDYSKQGPREVTSAAGVPECGKRFSLLMNPTSVGTSRCDVPRISGRHRRAAERGANGAARRPHQVQGEGGPASPHINSAGQMDKEAQKVHKHWPPVCLTVKSTQAQAWHLAAARGDWFGLLGRRSSSKWRSSENCEADNTHALVPSTFVDVADGNTF